MFRRAAQRAVQSISGFSLQQSRGVYSLPVPRTLDQVVKLELLAKVDTPSIRKVWEEHHLASEGRLGLVLEEEGWRQFKEIASSNPMFVLPLAKGRDAFITFLVQIQPPHALFTLLDDYHRAGTNAHPHLILTHFDDLVADKGIVLVRGDITSSELLSDKKGALWLANTLHDFYASGDAQKQDIVYKFNNDPAAFSFESLRKACGQHLPPH